MRGRSAAWVTSSVRLSEAVGNRAEDERADDAGHQHERELPDFHLPRFRPRNDPQRDEGQQGEPGDAAQHDHSDEDQHGPEPRLTG